MFELGFRHCAIYNILSMRKAEGPAFYWHTGIEGQLYCHVATWKSLSLLLDASCHKERTMLQSFMLWTDGFCNNFETGAIPVWIFVDGRCSSQSCMKPPVISMFFQLLLTLAFALEVSIRFGSCLFGGRYASSFPGAYVLQNSKTVIRITITL